MITTFLAFAVTDLVGVRAVAVPAEASASTSAWALRGWPAAASAASRVAGRMIAITICVLF